MSLLNNKLAWLTRNISLFHKICNGNGPIIIFPTMSITARVVIVITKQEPQEKRILLPHT